MEGRLGAQPAVHTPFFVLTHHRRPSIEKGGGTTFHGTTPRRPKPLSRREAAAGKDVRLCGGATMIRSFLGVRLVDHMHVVMVPILLGRGVRLWDGLEGVEKDYKVETVSSPSGVTHLTFMRRKP